MVVEARGRSCFREESAVNHSTIYCFALALQLFSITPLLLGLHKGHHLLLNHGTLNPAGESDRIGTAQGGLGG
ncbi:hypothetical protein LOK49_LG07G03363 [Camellia lanceoleosa]|uniref:Uncharacterized protein n=1 Tax=Camellia lanceoleosa TaxID=1840588 RepID=A0ACC0H147_9ERIC|nr:hypothetical protein LOK49_LG07G03363 [Camellia lanceoleosa]